ncbi:MarR family winged helix-turn-helix transcriptional regulator [Oceanobacillus polygoni]|uniref:DNA-binding MarR family transcriptional regulator n=1 Tax=Oceanobacillus polygoni TaxID=1235259 RepID=A0A9X0YXS4_9BACI|nr:winged helix DNA-binding protein [Oceanobacillus polygoni]MBP2079130.1 DNA-binding MarR family transcriptional regulator [Oceanobacillus polygoni]
MRIDIKEAEKFRYLVLAVQRQGNRLLKSYFKEIGVTPSQAEVITILKDTPFITLKQLGALLICEEGSPSRLVERMVKDQLIERIKDKKDSRFVRLTLTPLGNEKYSVILKAENEMYNMLHHVYTQEELQQSNQMLSKLLKDTPFEQKLEERDFSLKG